ncbi:MAG: 50S ribosomal protein L11 methyltransferase, partial [Alphaproteobacteria bacterium]|nr:50S ribosomal protein L11 methyltransferase [Alphaproteobacteria bacterium]
HAEAVSMFEARSDGTIWRIAGYAEAEPDRAAIEGAAAVAASAAQIGMPAIRIEALADRDWLAENAKNFKPVNAGRLHVHPTDRSARARRGSIAIALDAGPAFGSGSHETTRGCLLALDRLADRARFRPKRLLDLGCGSGILAIAMAKLWGEPVDAVDHDPVAVETAAANARRNDVGSLVKVRAADALEAGTLKRGGRFDLITANIVANPLMAIAKPLAGALAPGGFVILSGILREQERAVRSAYRAAGLRAAGSARLGEWPTLILRRPITEA